MLQRERLAAERRSFTHRFEILTEAKVYVFYLTCGVYANGRLGELFIHAGKMGSFISGVLDGYAISISIGLQSGVSLETYTAKMRYMRFEPAGRVVGAPTEITGNSSDYFYALSPFDYIAAYLNLRFPAGKLANVAIVDPDADADAADAIDTLVDLNE